MSTRDQSLYLGWFLLWVLLRLLILFFLYLQAIADFMLTFYFRYPPPQPYWHLGLDTSLWWGLACTLQDVY